MPALMQNRLLPMIALGLAAIVAPLVAPNDYIIGTLARICLYATLALGLNIVVGFAGLLDIGYVAFFGIGSYVYALLCSPHFGLHLPFLFALPIVVIVTALFGILIGAPTLRLGGDYLAIVTLGFGEITYLLLLNLDRPVNITNGPSGLIDIDPPALFGHVASNNTQYYYLFLAMLALVLLLARRLQHSRIGWAWQAIREDELAARTMGINTMVAKLQAFAVGASFAGFAGALPPPARKMSTRPAPLSDRKMSPFGATRRVRGCLNPPANSCTAKPSGTFGSAPCGGWITFALLAIDFSASVAAVGAGRSEGFMWCRTPGASAFQSAKGAAPVRTFPV